jgi:glycosyltransferase involved in cell wall biosynthesis
MSLYIDLTEFLAVPMKTGIQRIEGELCRYSPPEALIPVRLHSGRYVRLSTALIGAIGGYFRNASELGIAEIHRLSVAETSSPIEVTSEDTVLVPEIFGEQRAEFFRGMPEEQLCRCRFIVYDLLPFTHPQYFPPDMCLNMFGYYDVVRRASCCGFISEYTRETYYARLKRTPDRGGVVLPLGCDSLGAKANRPAPNRPLTFSVLGTIEPRKNHELILDAFEQLLRKIEGLKLVYLGKSGWVDREFARRVEALASNENSGFEFRPASDDGTIRRCIEESRATIYVSAAEGYGLPPVESLWLGTPVIASSTVPSLQGLGSSGVHVVEPLNVINLRRAVLAFLEDEYADRKAAEACDLKLPTWHSFTEEVLRWCGRG